MLYSTYYLGLLLELLELEDLDTDLLLLVPALLLEDELVADLRLLLEGEEVADLLDDDLVADLLVLLEGEVAREEDLLLVLLVEEVRALLPVPLTLVLVALEEALVLPVVLDLLIVLLEEDTAAACVVTVLNLAPGLKGGQ